MMLCTGILRFGRFGRLAKNIQQKHLPPHQRTTSGCAARLRFGPGKKAADFCYFSFEGKMKQQVTSIEKPCSMMIHE